MLIMISTTAKAVLFSHSDCHTWYDNTIAIGHQRYIMGMEYPRSNIICITFQNNISIIVSIFKLCYMCHAKC